jgi:hypothetical protein
MCNDIPFANMSRSEAESKPWSAYATFCQSLYGYLVFDKETADKWTKSELFAKHGDSPKDLELITQHTHPDYKFINKDEWNKI